MSRLSEYVGGKISAIQNNPNESAVRAILAKLRKGLGKQPGDNPDLWEFTLNEFPQEHISKSDKATPGEFAVYTALTLYALHQQGKPTKTAPMNARGHVVGIAVQRLARKRDADTWRSGTVYQRFVVAATSKSIGELTYYLRSLVKLMRSEGIQLDYSALTDDVYRFQFGENDRQKVRLRWGQDFYRTLEEDNKNEQE